MYLNMDEWNRLIVFFVENNDKKGHDIHVYGLFLWFSHVKNGIFNETLSINI